MARRPFWLSPNDFSTIYFLVARIACAGVLSSLSGKWSIAVFVPAGFEWVERGAFFGTLRMSEPEAKPGAARSATICLMIFQF